MKKQNILVIVVVVIAVISVFYSFLGSEDPGAYLKSIQQERDDKDHFMRTSSESPFKDNKSDFRGLHYFPPDIKYRIVASLSPIKEKNVVVLHTNDGEEQHYLPHAYADFDLDNVNNKLLILEIMDDVGKGTLFLAFGDETSARETYGAGRYLDVKKVPGSSTITLDFNKAYNPYCAYSETYSCPLPPAENLLRIPIRAGEKTYQQHE
jgi:uncharacterized protein